MSFQYLLGIWYKWIEKLIPDIDSQWRDVNR